MLCHETHGNSIFIKFSIASRWVKNTLWLVETDPPIQIALVCFFQSSKKCLFQNSEHCRACRICWELILVKFWSKKSKNELSFCHKLQFLYSLYLCNLMAQTFNISNLDYLSEHNSEFEISKIYDIGLQR